MSKGEHNHIIDIRDVEKKKRVDHAIEQAASTSKNTRLIIAESLEGAEEEVMVQMPTGDNFARRLRSRRQKTNPIPKAPSTLDFILDPNDVTTNNDEPFLMCDMSSPNIGRIMMFTTSENIEFLGTCDHIHMDGTFSTSPDLFEQVYVIHGETLFHKIQT